MASSQSLCWRMWWKPLTLSQSQSSKCLHVQGFVFVCFSLCVRGTCRASKVLTPKSRPGQVSSPLLIFHYWASITKDQWDPTIKTQEERVGNKAYRERSLTAGGKTERGRKRFKVPLRTEARSHVWNENPQCCSHGRGQVIRPLICSAEPQRDDARQNNTALKSPSANQVSFFTTHLETSCRNWLFGEKKATFLVWGWFIGVFICAILNGIWMQTVFKLPVTKYMSYDLWISAAIIRVAPVLYDILAKVTIQLRGVNVYCDFIYHLFINEI